MIASIRCSILGRKVMFDPLDWLPALSPLARSALPAVLRPLRSLNWAAQ